MNNLRFLKMCTTWSWIRIRIWISISIKMQSKIRIRIWIDIKTMPIHIIGTGTSFSMGFVFGLILCDSFCGHKFLLERRSFQCTSKGLKYIHTKYLHVTIFMKTVFRIWIVSGSNPGGRKWPTKISCFEALNVLFWGLKASSVDLMSFMEA